MALARTCRNIVHRLLPQAKSNRQWLGTTVESQRQPCSAGLEERIDRCRKTGRSLTCLDRCKALTECRRELPEMASVAVAVRRGTLKRLQEAFMGFFRRVAKGGAPGFPRFKGCRFLDGIGIVSGVKVGNGRPMTVRRKGGNPHPDGRPVSAVLERTDGRWHALACFAVEAGEGAGNGRGSARRKKASRRRKIANRRHDRHRHASRDLAAKAGTVAVEGLNVKGMTKGAKGTLEEPGTNVPRKSGLNRVILDTGWTAPCRNARRPPSSRFRHQAGQEQATSAERSADAHAEPGTASPARPAGMQRMPASMRRGTSWTDASARRGALASATSTTREIVARVA